MAVKSLKDREIGTAVKFEVSRPQRERVARYLMEEEVLILWLGRVIEVTLGVRERISSSEIVEMLSRWESYGLVFEVPWKPWRLRTLLSNAIKRGAFERHNFVCRVGVGFVAKVREVPT